MLYVAEKEVQSHGIGHTTELTSGLNKLLKGSSISMVLDLTVWPGCLRIVALSYPEQQSTGYWSEGGWSYLSLKRKEGLFTSTPKDTPERRFRLILLSLLARVARP